MLKKVATESVITVAAMAAEIAYKDYGKLKNKKTRIQTFIDLFLESLININNPTELRSQLEAEMRAHIMI